MIEVNHLSKRFESIMAVDDISFAAGKGEILGFLGPNGAGKSTTMKMITGFILPSDGEALVCGKKVQEVPTVTKGLIGYMSENAPLYDDMYVEDFLRYAGELRQMAADKIEAGVNRVIDLCALTSARYQKIETLSKGFRRRVSMAQALIHDPEVLILDEPTDGLDPNQKHEVRTLIRQLSGNKCIVLSTHILEEVEEVCTRAIIIAKGKLLYDGTPADLKSKSKQHKLDDVFRAITTGESVQGVNL